jgi:hypothetical protein
VFDPGVFFCRPFGLVFEKVWKLEKIIIFVAGIPP